MFDVIIIILVVIVSIAPSNLLSGQLLILPAPTLGVGALLALGQGGHAATAGQGCRTPEAVHRRPHRIAGHVAGIGEQQEGAASQRREMDMAPRQPGRVRA